MVKISEESMKKAKEKRLKDIDEI